MLTIFHVLGARMDIKIHCLISHLNKFFKNLGDVSEEQIERFNKILNQWKKGIKDDGTVT